MTFVTQYLEICLLSNTSETQFRVQKNISLEPILCHLKFSPSITHCPVLYDASRHGYQLNKW